MRVAKYRNHKQQQNQRRRCSADRRHGPPSVTRQCDDRYRYSQNYEQRVKYNIQRISEKMQSVHNYAGVSVGLVPVPLVAVSSCCFSVAAFAVSPVTAGVRCTIPSVGRLAGFVGCTGVAHAKDIVWSAMVPSGSIKNDVTVLCSLFF